MGGVKFANKTVTTYATGSGIPTIVSSLTGTRVVQVIQDGDSEDLVYSDPLGTSGSGLYIADPLPEPAANTTTNAAQLALNEGGTPNDFAISPDGNTVYIADGRAYVNSSTQGGGIERWDWNGSGYALAMHCRRLEPTARKI